jgi:hypothetical protein
MLYGGDKQKPINLKSPMYRSTHKKETPQYSFVQENREQEAAR